MKKFLVLLIPIIMITSCGKQDNPFFGEYDTPFGIPPFEKIKNEHFVPAFEKAMEEHNAEIERIIKNDSAPTFQNTIEAFEYSGGMLTKVSNVFYNYDSSKTDDEIAAIAQEMGPKLSSHYDEILLNEKLFERIKSVYEQMEQINLSSEQKRLLSEMYKRFVRNGALLSEESRTRLKEINQRLSSLTIQFGQNILKDVNSYRLIIENEADLAGLTKAVIDNAAERAANEGNAGKWAFTLHNPSVMPFLHSADNRELRKQMQQAFINRGNNNNDSDNKKIIGEIVNLRLERSKILGYNTFADFVLEDRMAGDVTTVMDFLKQMWTPALAIAKAEAYDLQALIKKEGHDFELAQWDWRYYSEKLRKERYDLDEEEIRQYFELNTVKDGIFMVTNKLWGLKYEERNDLPKYHKDVQVYEVLDADNTHLGILFMDFHPRDSKIGGAWMNSYRKQHVDQNGKFVSPIITVVCNFTPPSGDTPSLLTYDEMTTFFHEFGHALHGLLSDCRYLSLSGTSVPRDFVELPSQVMENWANEPEILKSFALHYQTGEQMPDELIEKIKNAGHFNTGFSNVEFIASAFLDMEYHMISEYFNEAELENVASIINKRTIEKYGLIPEIAFRHGSTHFSHIFAGGYSAGYYSYLWSGLLDADVYEAFREAGNLFDQETAARLRNTILERGGTKDAMEMYIDFRGRKPIVEPLLKQRGLL
ncbi:MAG: M3 family metallopeptidase [Bacteroidetes bacterium]|nr:M3 family metallopeptidase [Bacteroidota bacterium]